MPTDEAEKITALAKLPSEGRGRFFDPGRPRRAVNLIHRAVSEGWGVKDEDRAILPSMLSDIARDADQDIRTRVKAIDTLRMMAKDNVDAAVALDKVERLEDPECATEKVSKRVEVVFVNRLPERA